MMRCHDYAECHYDYEAAIRLRFRAYYVIFGCVFRRHAAAAAIICIFHADAALIPAEYFAA